MCLIVSKNYKKKIAENDIVCYKVVEPSENDGFVISKCQNFKYEFNKLYNDTICIEKDEYEWCYADTKEGEDYNIANLFLYEFRKKIKERKLQLYSKGFHSFGSISRAKENIFEDEECSIIKCTIPKGSEYIRNKSNCLISNQIIINEIVYNGE